MNHPSVYVTGLFCLVCASCSSDSSSGTSSGAVSAECEKACAASDAKACPGEPRTGAACRSNCQSDRSQIPKECLSQGDAFFKCAAAVPASDLICTTDHGSDLPAGRCETEKDAMLTCLGLPPGSDGG
jgi:hypothetical protein